MRSKFFIISALLFAGILFVSGALASAPHPSQMGDLGGVRAKEIEQQVKNNATHPSNNQKAAPVSALGYSAPERQGRDSYDAVTDNEMETDVVSGEENTDETNTLSASEHDSLEKLPPPAELPTQTLDWFGVGYDLINKNKNISIYDVKTGITWKAVYINGRNHADIIPASAEDAIKLTNNRIVGDYVRRPVVVTIGGLRFAGSMYAEGHGSTSYASYFKGVLCIHFTGSMTHGTQKIDKDHQNAILEALKH